MTRKRLLAAAVVVVTFCVAVGSAGGRSTDSSASADVLLTGLIGTGSNVVQQVTFGGKMGFHLEVKNTGTSTFNHLVIIVRSGPDTSFFDSSQPKFCAAAPGDATQMVCKLQQMQGGAPPFSVDLRFTAPASGSTVHTTSSLTTDAQTQGSPGNKGTQTFGGTSVDTTLDGAGNTVKTFARGKETIATASTLLQHSKFTMPDSLLFDLFGIDTSVQEETVPTAELLCADCPAFVTILKIPDSTGTSSPFSATNFFTFTITLLPDGVPKSYTPTGLYHDGTLVPLCSVSDLGPDTPMCLTSFQTKNFKKNGIVATGEAYQNGRLGFG